MIMAKTEKVRFRMSLRQFVQENRKEIDAVILRQCPNIERLNDGERQLWVLNDEGLYNWARENRVRV